MNSKKKSNNPKSNNFKKLPLTKITLSTAFVLALALSLTSTYNQMKISENESSVLGAFPDAQGFNSGSITGGRGGYVYIINSLSDGFGSGTTVTLRDCIEDRLNKGTRNCVFTIGGTIVARTSMTVKKPNITIAGQTAQGDGIMLKNDPSLTASPLMIQASNVIIRYLRVRGDPGNGQIPANSLDAVTIGNPKAALEKIIIDHSSFSWGIDEVLGLNYVNKNIILQRSIIAEGLHCVYSSGQCHGKGMLIYGGKVKKTTSQSGNVSVHHNLFAHNPDRNIRFATQRGFPNEFVNNVIYNYGLATLASTDTSIDPVPAPEVNVVNNYYKKGPSSPAVTYEINPWINGNRDANPGEVGPNVPYAKFFISGNKAPHQAGQVAVNMIEDKRVPASSPNRFVPFTSAHPFWAATPHNTPVIASGVYTNADVAYSSVVGTTGNYGDVGANKKLNCNGTLQNRLDSVDTRIITSAQNGTGSFINNPSQVGGYPTYQAGTACADSDKDGLPDLYEAQYSSMSNSVNNASQNPDGDSYTNLEEYFNGTNPIVANQ